METLLCKCELENISYMKMAEYFVLLQEQGNPDCIEQSRKIFNSIFNGDADLCHAMEARLSALISVMGDQKLVNWLEEQGCSGKSIPSHLSYAAAEEPIVMLNGKLIFDVESLIARANGIYSDYIQ